MDNNRLKEALDKLLMPGIYGHLELDINDGEVAVLRETVTTKFTTRRGNPRHDHNNK